MEEPGKKKEDSGGSQYILQSVSNALAVLDLLGSYETLSVAEVARLMKIGKTTAFRLLYTLENSGFVAKDEAARYRLSLKLAILGSAVTGRMEIVKIAHPFLEELSGEFQETVHLVLWNSDTDVVVADRVIGLSPISYQTSVGYVTRPAHYGASGQILLAFADRKRLEQYLEAVDWSSCREPVISDPSRLLDLLEKVRREEVAVNDGDAIPGLYCYAVPVRDHENRVIASLSLSGPEANLLRKKDEIIRSLKNCAARIQEQIRKDSPFCPIST